MDTTIFAPLCMTAIVSYLLVGWWSVYRHMTHSPLLPFSLTKYLAGLGKNVPLDTFGSQAGGLTRHRIVDHRYQEWLMEVVDRGHTTNSIYMMFNNQRAKEIRNELDRRKAL